MKEKIKKIVQKKERMQNIDLKCNPGGVDGGLKSTAAILLSQTIFNKNFKNSITSPSPDF